MAQNDKACMEAWNSKIGSLGREAVNIDSRAVVARVYFDMPPEFIDSYIKHYEWAIGCRLFGDQFPDEWREYQRFGA